MGNQDIVENLVEIQLKSPDDFLKVRETLSRIGVAPKGEKRLYQSCHILHKRGRYFVAHFKEMLALDGKATNFSDDDRKRRNTIAGLLAEWGLVNLVDKTQIEDKAPLSLIKVIPFREKSEWDLHVKYNIGNSHR